MSLFATNDELFAKLKAGNPGFDVIVPSNEFVNVSAGYRVNNYLRVHAIATNLFDEKRFQLYGGSVIGRRVLAGITAGF